LVNYVTNLRLCAVRLRVTD